MSKGVHIEEHQKGRNGNIMENITVTVKLTKKEYMQEWRNNNKE